MALTLTGAEVLTHVRKSSPAADDTAWAAAVAAAVLALVTRRKGSATLTTDQESELKPAMLQAAADGYSARDARYGVLSIGPDGDVARIADTLGKSMDSLFIRMFGPGIG